MYDKTKRPPILPLEVKPEMRIQVLNEKDLEKIQEAAFTILEERGVEFPSEKALKILAEGGARVDFKRKVAKFPADWLQSVLARAPRSFVMASRTDPELDLNLDGTKTYYGTDGVGVRTGDFTTRKERPSAKEDVAMMALISDYLPCVSFYWPIVSAQNVKSETIPLHELEASFSHTEKHIHIVSCVQEKAARHCVDMARIVAGDSAAARRRPPLSLVACTRSPLCQDLGAIEAALVFAEAGLPVGFMAMPQICLTAPATMAGALVMGHAEVLSAVCLIQLAQPGAPVYYALSAEMMNPFSGRALGGAMQKPLLNAGRVHIGHFNNLPVMAYYGSTSSKQIDWKAGKENAIDSLLLLLTGPELFPTLGLLDEYTLLYPEKILFDYEIFESLRIMTEGIDVSSETLAVDEIMDVGPGGHFFERASTIRNLKRLWKPGIVHEWSHARSDFRNPHEVALEKCKWILDNHRPRPLPEGVSEELRKVIQRAESE